MSAEDLGISLIFSSGFAFVLVLLFQSLVKFFLWVKSNCSNLPSYESCRKKRKIYCS